MSGETPAELLIRVQRNRNVLGFKKITSGAGISVVENASNFIISSAVTTGGDDVTNFPILNGTVSRTLSSNSIAITPTAGNLKLELAIHNSTTAPVGSKSLVESVTKGDASIKALTSTTINIVDNTNSLALGYSILDSGVGNSLIASTTVGQVNLRKLTSANSRLSLTPSATAIILDYADTGVTSTALPATTTTASLLLDGLTTNPKIKSIGSNSLSITSAGNNVILETIPAINDNTRSMLNIGKSTPTVIPLGSSLAIVFASPTGPYYDTGLWNYALNRTNLKRESYYAVSLSAKVQEGNTSEFLIAGIITTRLTAINKTTSVLTVVLSQTTYICGRRQQDVLLYGVPKLLMTHDYYFTCEFIPSSTPNSPSLLSAVATITEIV